MSSFPVGIARAPSMLMSQAGLASIQQSNLGLYRLSAQLSTGIAINRPGDDVIKGAAITLLDTRVERSERLLSNFGYATDSLNILDQALGEGTDLLNEAKSLALEQMNTGTTSEERANQAVVVQSVIDSMLRLSNRESIVGHVFGGSRPGAAPMESFGGGFRFVGQRGGLTTDLGALRDVPITLGANNVLGSMSARVTGAVDLDPALADDTRLVDLDGARGLGITLGTVKASFNGGEAFEVDLADADTVGDVLDRIRASIGAYEDANDVTVLGPGGVSIDGRTISIDIPDGELVFKAVSGGVTGRDLGLVVAPVEGFSEDRASTPDLQPKLAWNTPISALQALEDDLGTILVKNAGTSARVDLSGAETMADIRTLIEGAGLGVRVELNEAGTGFNVVSEVATTKANALSIEEVDGQTAEALGIRSMVRGTELSVFNDGHGVDIVDGAIDPETGLYDTHRNIDFTISLGDGFEIPVDLRPEDALTVGTVLDRINEEAQAALSAAGRPATDFEATLTDTANGIALIQAGGISGAITVDGNNNSTAASQLGLLDGTYDDAAGMLLGQDRATARPDNAFTALIDLREALLGDDEVGIGLAAERLDDALERIVESRALVAGYTRRVEDESLREEDRQVMDVAMRSQLRDLDYASAASRFAQLQTQLQAGLQTTAQLSQLSLLNFLG
jgi:flagellin-like hook-associated protein FlgL